LGASRPSRCHVKPCSVPGRDRIESDRFIALRSHHGFDSFFCEPGEDGAHEKGGVEGEGGRFRRNHLVPVPKVKSLAELNTRLAKADRADDHRRISGRVRTVGTPPSSVNAAICPSRNASCDWVGNTRCTDRPKSTATS